MKRKLLEFAFVLTLGVLVLPAVAQAGDILHIQGPSVWANFSSSQGCVETSVFANFNPYRVQFPPGSGVAQENYSVVAISQFDTCQGIQLVDAYGFGYVGADLPGGQESYIAKGLESARLKTTIPAFDQVSGNTYDVSIDLTWTAIGPPIRTNTHSHFKAPGLIVNEHFNGTNREAECSGTVDYGTGNLTPELSIGANILIVKSGRVLID